VLVVNKGDREGVDLTLRDLTTMLEIAERPAWPGEAPRPRPPLVRTVAATGEGVDGLVAALAGVRGAAPQDRAARRRRQAASQVLAIVSELARDAARDAIGDEGRPGPAASTIASVAARTLDPWSAAERIAAQAGGGLPPTRC
jgi:LAO/AO transport system kinase